MDFPDSKIRRHHGMGGIQEGIAKSALSFRDGPKDQIPGSRLRRAPE
jgi:hypothetical protein